MDSAIVSAGFQFSQGSLRDYSDCRRRFLLRYVKQLEWPAPITAKTEQLEEAMERGKRFHDLVYQDALDIDVSKLVAESNDARLKEAWHNYERNPPDLPAGREFSELELSAPLAGCRLTAKLDRLILTDDGRAVIVDWKTGERLPTLEMLRSDWQTIVYRYVVAEAAHELVHGAPFAPQDVSLLYWYALHPNELPPLAYSATEHSRAHDQLQAVITEIAGLKSEDEFIKTDDWDECRRCRYRSYCNRGREPADDFELREDELELDVIFEMDM